MKLSDGLRDVPDAQWTCIFRIVQEALTNCARHSEARHLTVIVERVDNHVRTQIIDDGVGLDVEVPEYRGLGMIGMRERPDELGGHLQVRSTKGQGTTVQVAVPLPPEILVPSN